MNINHCELKCVDWIIDIALGAKSKMFSLNYNIIIMFWLCAPGAGGDCWRASQIISFFGNPKAKPIFLETQKQNTNGN